MANFILGALFGLLVGLAICYGRQAYGLYQNRDKIGAVSNLADSIEQTFGAFGIKI